MRSCLCVIRKREDMKLVVVRVTVETIDDSQLSLLLL